MSYRSPIEIVYGDIRTSLENNVYSIVQSYGINVDKAELIRALEYDRDQYEEGYADGHRDERTAKVETYTDDQQETWSVCECGTDVWKSYNYCPECGAKLDWSER